MDGGPRVIAGPGGRSELDEPCVLPYAWLRLACRMHHQCGILCVPRPGCTHSRSHWPAREGPIGQSRIYELLAPLGVVVAPGTSVLPYRATFDLEARQVPFCMGTFTSRHVPMPVSLASNVPGYEGPYNFISDGWPQRLVDYMMSCLWDMSDAAYCLTWEAMNPYCSQLDDLSFCHGKEKECTWDLEDGETEAGRMLSLSTGAHALSKAWQALKQWMRCMPVVSFSGGRYDLQLIKPYLATVYGTYAPPWLVALGLWGPWIVGGHWRYVNPWQAWGWDNQGPEGGLSLHSHLHRGSLRGLWCPQGWVRGHHDTPGRPHAWYPARECCKARQVYDEKTPGLFKTEWDGNGMVALSS